MKTLVLVGLALVLAGCSNDMGAKTTEDQKDEAGVSTEATPSATSDSQIGIQSPAMGGASPVTGSESVAGSGSGVGQAAKDQARRVAGQQQPNPTESTDTGTD